MTAMDVVERWDRSLRIGDWDAARALLAEDATYTAPGAPEGRAVDCATPDDIIALLRSFKAKLPDVEVVEWDPRDDCVIARLRQPAFGEDADWFQVLWVTDTLIAKMEDHPSLESAVAAAE
jgi:hypothetical protein